MDRGRRVNQDKLRVIGGALNNQTFDCPANTAIGDTLRVQRYWHHNAWRETPLTTGHGPICGKIFSFVVREVEVLADFQRWGIRFLTPSESSGITSMLRVFGGPVSVTGLSAKAFGGPIDRKTIPLVRGQHHHIVAKIPVLSKELFYGADTDTPCPSSISTTVTYTRHDLTLLDLNSALKTCYPSILIVRPYGVQDVLLRLFGT